MANPFAGLLPGTSLNGATVQQQQLLVPYPEFLINGVTEAFRPIGKSSYNSVQIVAAKRMSFGLNFNASYTISKQIDQTNFANPQDVSLERVIASWDIPQNLQINFLYELPFGSGKRMGADLPRPARWAISGWQVSTLTRLQKGMPMSFPSGAAPTGLNPALPSPSYTEWFNTCTQLASGATQNCHAGEQPAWTIRQANTLQMWSSRLASVRMPGVHNVDISVIKRNRLSERFELVFRTDFINGFNSPQFFSGPVTTVTSGNFGRISGAMDQSNLPRFIQLSLKLQFDLTRPAKPIGNDRRGDPQEDAEETAQAIQVRRFHDENSHDMSGFGHAHPPFATGLAYWRLLAAQTVGPRPGTGGFDRVGGRHGEQRWIGCGLLDVGELRIGRTEAGIVGFDLNRNFQRG